MSDTVKLKTLTSGDIFRALLLILAAASVLLMPESGQTPSWSAWDDTIITIIVPVTAPIVFVLLLMDIVMCCATDNSNTREKRMVLVAEGIAAVFILLYWLDFLLIAD